MSNTISDGIGWRHSNSLITTKRVHYPTKTASTTTNQVVPGFSRPNENGALLNVPFGPDRDAAAKEFIGPQGRARPMKHWRRKLQPTPNSGRSVNSVSLVIDTPGGTTKSGNGASCDCSNMDSNSVAKFDEKMLKIPSQKCEPCDRVENMGFVQVGNPADPNSYQIQTGLYNTKYIGVCPANNVIKSAVTLMSKAYYSDTRGYLQSRCKRYEQKLSTNPVPGIQYIGPDHTPNWPNNDCLGPQTRLTGSCLYPACSAVEQALQTRCQGTTIYKPNNVQFAKQGGVSSSTRTLNLRVNTVNLNGNSFYTAFGAQGANAGKYSTEYNPCYFVKNNYQPPNCKLYYGSKTGNHTVCFHTPTDYSTSGSSGSSGSSSGQTAKYAFVIVNAINDAINHGATTSFSSIIVYSMDGVRWNKANTDPTISHVNTWFIPEASKWIAYGSVVNSDSDASPQSYSNDGINWNQFNLSSIFNGDDDDYDVNYIPAASKWVAYGKKIAYSSDGVNWDAPSPQSNSSTIFSAINSIAYDGKSMWVAVGTNTNDNAIVAHSSDHGITWTASNIPIVKRSGNNIAMFNSIMDVAYNAGIWVMTGEGWYEFKCIATSTDGITWTAANHPGDYLRYVNVLLYNSNMSMWIAAGDKKIISPYSGPMLKSSNGTDWTPVNINMTDVDVGVSYSGKMVVWGSSTDNTVIATSKDGNTWTTADVSTIFDDVYDVAYNSELSTWVAAGIQSTKKSIIATSTDGITWKTATTPL